MHKGSIVAWQQFELMMRTGVPHAMDIACELSRSRLEVPLPTVANKLVVDLEFYCVIHRAYRAKVLPLFLSLMKLVKDTDDWIGLQACQEMQMLLVEVCEKNHLLPLNSLMEIVASKISSHSLPSDVSNKAA